MDNPYTTIMIHLFTLLLIGMAAFGGNEGTPNIHDFTMRTLDGEETELNAYRNKVVLVVNTASKCGFTGQYSELQELYETYAERGFVVLGFPSADFAGQEFGSDEEIAEFCERNYGVSFPMFSRISVKGEDQHPLFEVLTTEDNPDFTGDIEWNFEKFLIDGEGHLVRRFRSRTTPLSTEITSSVEALLES
jgi:glutathione peroxidase